jgi:intermembrane space import and assembly protein 40
LTLENKGNSFFSKMSYAKVDQEGKDVIVYLDEQPPRQAYNEETGEIDWDCPCLGNMVKPPCGDIFKEAFTCFVKSKQEPKGAECVQQFRAMTECFQKHPDIYGERED